MKKIVSLILALCLCLPLTVSVFAEEDGGNTEISVTKLQTPVAGMKIPSNAASQIEANLITEGKNEEKISVKEAVWTLSSAPTTALKAGASFVAGKTYRFTVTLEFAEQAPKVEKFRINGEKATLASSGAANIVFYRDFTAAAGDFTPKVTLEVNGDKAKTYDGKAVTLKATFEKTEGISYQCQWFFEGKKLENETEEKLVLKDVAQSGEYYCTVTAHLPDAPEDTKSTKSASETISITPLEVTVEIRDAEKNIDDPDPEFTYEILGDPYDEMTGTLSRDAGEKIGQYAIKLGNLAFDPEVADNYKVHVTEGKLNIIDRGALPFVSVSGIADQSYITGLGGTKIRVSATKGAIPEDAVLSLSIPESEVKKELEESLGKKVLKSFTLTLRDADGKNLALPGGASFRIQIPLTEEESKSFDPESITAALKSGSIISLESSVVEVGKTHYIEIQTDKQGTVALFEGKLTETKAPVTSEKKEPEKKTSPLWIWIIIVLLTLAAGGVIVFVILQNRKLSGEAVKPSAPVKKAPLTPEEQKEKEKARKIAEHLNSLPPIPTSPKNEENAMATRVIPTGEKKAPVAKEDKNEETRKVSFEDLEK